MAQPSPFTVEVSSGTWPRWKLGRWTPPPSTRAERRSSPQPSRVVVSGARNLRLPERRHRKRPSRAATHVITLAMALCGTRLRGFFLMEEHDSGAILGSPSARLGGTWHKSGFQFAARAYVRIQRLLVSCFLGERRPLRQHNGTFRRAA